MRKKPHEFVGLGSLLAVNVFYLVSVG